MAGDIHSPNVLFSEVKDKEPCYDTSTLHWEDFSDWTHGDVPLQKLLRFISLQAHVIHEEDPKVSSGCLQLAFRGSNGYMSVALRNQLHCGIFQGR